MVMQARPEHITVFILDCLEALLPHATPQADSRWGVLGRLGRAAGPARAPTPQPNGQAAAPAQQRQRAERQPAGGGGAAAAADSSAGASQEHASNGAASPPQPPGDAGIGAGAAATAMHLLLDLTPGCLDRVSPEALVTVRRRAAALLRAMLAAAAPPRPALKTAQAFRLGSADVAAWRDELQGRVRELLLDASTATPAIGLLQHFQASHDRRRVPQRK